jgi:hypothetical protein
VLRGAAYRNRGQQTPAAEAWLVGDGAEHVGLDRQADRERWPFGELWLSALAVDPDGVAGVAFEVGVQGWPTPARV